MSVADAIKRARETSQGYLGSRFGAPAESDSESIYIATTRNAWKAAVDVIAAAEGLRRLQQSECAVYPELMGAYQKGLDNALAAFAEAMGKP